MIYRMFFGFQDKNSAQLGQYPAITLSLGVVDKHESEQQGSIFQRKLNSCPAVLQMKRPSKHVWYANRLPTPYFT